MASTMTQPPAPREKFGFFGTQAAPRPDMPGLLIRSYWHGPARGYTVQASACVDAC